MNDNITAFKNKLYISNYIESNFNPDIINTLSRFSEIIKDEEELLVEELDGYAEYKIKVKYKLIPFIW